MTIIKTRIPALYRIYMMIAEPRVRRLLYFIVYLGLGMASMSVFFKPPTAIENILGGAILIYTFGGFITLGCLIGAFSVLPGIWWFERVGLYAIATGIAMYVATLLFLGASPMVVVIPIVLIMVLALRWLDIREYLLAPREG